MRKRNDRNWTSSNSWVTSPSVSEHECIKTFVLAVVYSGYTWSGQSLMSSDERSDRPQTALPSLSLRILALSLHVLYRLFNLECSAQGFHSCWSIYSVTLRFYIHTCHRQHDSLQTLTFQKKFKILYYNTLFCSVKIISKTLHFLYIYIFSRGHYIFLMKKMISFNNYNLWLEKYNILL